jgi:hypothetical protein
MIPIFLLPEEEQYFSELLERSSGVTRKIAVGELFYHGFQGEVPELHDLRTLWMSPLQERAHDYARWGCQDRVPGMIELSARHDLEFNVLNLDGPAFLSRFNYTGHIHYATKLHLWAHRHGVQGAVDGTEVLSFRAASDFEVIRVQLLRAA